jgi:hypothetical protein
MTIEQLIKFLSQYPPESHVVVQVAPNEYAVANVAASLTAVRKEDLHSTEEIVGQPAVFLSF